MNMMNIHQNCDEPTLFTYIFIDTYSTCRCLMFDVTYDLRAYMGIRALCGYL